MGRAPSVATGNQLVTEPGWSNRLVASHVCRFIVRYARILSGIDSIAMVVSWTFSGVCACQHVHAIARALETTMDVMVLDSMQRMIANVQRACSPAVIGNYGLPQGTIRNGTTIATYCLNINNEMRRQ